MTITDKERVGRTLAVLAYDVMMGSLSDRAARTILEAHENGWITSCRSFFATAYNALVRETLLYYSKVMVSKGKCDSSVNLPYLLHLAQSTPTVFRVDADQVRESVVQHQAWLNSMGELTERVRAERDHIIAHLDRKLVNFPEGILRKPPVPMSQVERAFAKMLEIVNVYKGFFGDSEVRITTECSNVVADVRYLFERLHADDRAGSAE